MTQIHQTLHSAVADADVDLRIIALVDVLGVLGATTFASCQGDEHTSAYVAMLNTQPAVTACEYLRRTLHATVKLPRVNRAGNIIVPVPRRRRIFIEDHRSEGVLVLRLGAAIDQGVVATRLWSLLLESSTYRTGLFGEVILHESETRHAASH